VIRWYGAAVALLAAALTAGGCATSGHPPRAAAPDVSATPLAAVASGAGGATTTPPGAPSGQPGRGTAAASPGAAAGGGSGTPVPPASAAGSRHLTMCTGRHFRCVSDAAAYAWWPHSEFLRATAGARHAYVEYSHADAFTGGKRADGESLWLVLVQGTHATPADDVYDNLPERGDVLVQAIYRNHAPQPLNGTNMVVVRGHPGLLGTSIDHGQHFRVVYWTEPVGTASVMFSAIDDPTLRSQSAFLATLNALGQG
jgi:hypothetical protein